MNPELLFILSGVWALIEGIWLLLVTANIELDFEDSFGRHNPGRTNENYHSCRMGC